MRRGWTAFVVASLAGLSPALAFQDPPTTQPTAPRQIIFDQNDTVTGTPQSPDGDLVVVHPPERLPSLIQVRADFRDALLQSAADL